MDRINIIGKKFGRLTAIKYSHNTGKPRWQSYWLCICRCGNKKIVVISNLLSNHTRSCGCIKKEMDPKRLTTHGKSNTDLYKKWRSMQKRVKNPDARGNACYKNIKCEWGDFTDFYKDMNSSFKKHVQKYGFKNTSLDRINNKKNYCKSNCRWVTLSEQGKNTSKVVFLKYKNKFITMSDMVNMSGICYSTIRRRRRFGWSVEEMVKIKPVIGSNQKLRQTSL